MKLLSLILSLAISISLFFVFIDPFYKDIKELKNDVSVYNKALTNSSDLKKTRDILIDDYKKIKKEDKDKLNHLLPSSIDNIELILEIEKIANLYGMPIEDIKFDAKSMEDGSSSKVINVFAGGAPSSNLPYGIFPLEFSVEGKYDTFISFLKELEKNLRIVDVKSISFNSNSNSSLDAKGIDNSGIYNYSLKIQTYWLK